MSELAVETAIQAEKIKVITTNYEDIKQRLINVEQIALNVEKLAMSIQAMSKNLETMSIQIKEITDEPSQKWKKMSWAIITLVLVAIVGIVTNKIGLGG